MTQKDLPDHALESLFATCTSSFQTSWLSCQIMPVQCRMLTLLQEQNINDTPSSYFSPQLSLFLLISSPHCSFCAFDSWHVLCLTYPLVPFSLSWSTMSTLPLPLPFFLDALTSFFSPCSSFHSFSFLFLSSHHCSCNSVKCRLK